MAVDKMAAAARKKLAELEKMMAANKIYHFNGDLWKPNPAQVEILKAWDDKGKKVFSFCGANRIGKCVTYDTLISTPCGEVSVGKLFDNKKQFDVYAWDGEKKVVAKASAPFKKEGLHECYRITMSDGRWIEAADHHRILLSDGRYVSTEGLFYTYSQSLLESNSGRGLSILPSGAVHLSGKQLNYLDDYFESFHQCDEQPQSEANSIISINAIGVKECFDFEVEKYHNYFAGGLINHNTTIGVVIAISVMAGKWLWSGEKIEFPHDMPRRVMYVGQGWETHIKTVVEPELRKLWPDCRKVEKKKNNQGVDAVWTDVETGSVLQVMSNNQESESFEGGQWDLIIWDEPPKRNNRIAGARGLVDRQGRELFVATLLTEAWINRDVIKARLPDGSPDTSVFNINADISVNVGYGLTQEGVDQFSKTLREKEREARLHGKPAFLGNLVLPEFNRDIHLKDRFKVPLNWVVDVSIDFHPSKKWAVLFVATDPLNYHYAVDFIHENGNPKYIAEEIVRKAKNNNYFLRSITIDPLSKGDENAHCEAQTVYKIIETVLRAYNYKLETATKDKDNGISILNDWLMSENHMPSLFFFKDMGTVIEQVEDWMYDPDTLKPSKENDDFCEVLYRIALHCKKWRDPYDRDKRMSSLPKVDMGEVAFG